MLKKIMLVIMLVLLAVGVHKFKDLDAHNRAVEFLETELKSGNECSYDFSKEEGNYYEVTSRTTGQETTVVRFSAWDL